MPGLRNTARGWGWGARGFHWAMAVLILFMLGLGFRVAHLVPDLGQRYGLTQLHKSWGAVAFALAVLRLVWRAVGGARPPPVPMPRWQERAAGLSHAALYLLMILMPVSGWVMAAASPLQDLLGEPNMVFGALALPDPWMPGNEAVSDTAHLMHRAAAILLAALIALHVAAALWHQFVLRDGLISRMLRGPRPPAPPIRR